MKWGGMIADTSFQQGKKERELCYRKEKKKKALFI